MGTLYLVGTPIGNLEDVTLRALRTLREVPLIAAEDTRVTRRLLAHYQIQSPLTSYHEHNKLAKLADLLDHLRTQDLALVSDAGMPGVSDPGYELVRAAVENSIPVVVVPGPSAVISALVVSGLATDEYVYLGFVPRRAATRRGWLERLAAERRTAVAYEAPHRLLATLQAIHQILGERQLAVVRELTKLYEEVKRGTAAALLAHFTEHPPRGEITLVIGGALPQEPPAWTDQAVENALADRLQAGETPAAAAKAITRLSGRRRDEVYRIAMRIRSA